MSLAVNSVGVSDMATAMSNSAGAIHDRIAETGPKLAFPKAQDTKVYIAKLADLGMITAEDVADLNSLWDEITNKQEPEPQVRITAAGNRILARDNRSEVAATIAGIAIASAAKAAKSPIDIPWETVAADVAGGLVGGVAGGIAGGMAGRAVGLGTPGAIAGGIAGAIVVGGLASSE